MKLVPLNSKWEECLKLLDVIGFSGKVGAGSLNYVIAGAFLHDQPNTALRLLKRLVSQHYAPSDVTKSAYFAWAKRKGLDQVMEMLAFFRDNDFFMSLEVAKDLRLWMEKEAPEKWTGKFITLTPKYAHCIPIFLNQNFLLFEDCFTFFYIS